MYKGTSASAGIGIGKAVIVEEAELVIARQTVSDVEGEVQRFKGALDETMKATEKLAEDLATRVGEKEAEIMQGHMMLLADPMLTGEIENSIRNDNVNAEFAIENVCNMYADMFASMGDELMQQRATDMRDIKTRMQQMLMGIQSVDISSLPAGLQGPSQGWNGNSGYTTVLTGTSSFPSFSHYALYESGKRNLRRFRGLVSRLKMIPSSLA